MQKQCNFVVVIHQPLFCMINYLRRHKIRTAIGCLLLLWYIFCLPRTLFKEGYATIVESREGKLLGGKIAPDGQWRFPERDSVPHKLREALLAYEDAHFYYHWGVNPVSTTKALLTNLRHGRTIRGGSTLTQQVIRLARKNKARTYGEKLVEAIWATRLEFRYSKEKILALYASHAPFGGNVIGADMAAWRYFGVSPEQLSWAEACTLAVLPNAPGLIYPGRNQLTLKKKRDFLLEKLFKNHTIDKTTYELSLQEPLVERPHELPNIAPHLVERIARTAPNKRQLTTIDYYLQERVQEVVAKYHRHYKRFEVHNLCALVVDVHSREVLAYVGNSPTDEEHQKDVNIIHRPRSTGSVLKPFLYAAMLDSGELLPQEITADVPTHIGGYSPENFENTYEGAVPADEALYRSLNIPFVLLLRQYGISRFYQQLQKLRLRSINRSADHYGLSLILGGAESSLWELSQAYANMGFELNEFAQTGKYRSHAFQKLTYLKNNRDYGELQEEKNHFSAGAIYKTFEALTQVNRPSFDSAWRYYTSSRKISWKTGTSFGNRDAWAIGLTSRYLVGVWVGNASGEGRPELTGVGTAAPVMLEIFQLLKKDKWFDTPWEDLQKVEVCTLSGMIASDLCPKKTIWVPQGQLQTTLCKYHKWVHLSPDGLWQVNSNCEDIAAMRSESWFVLPPLMEWFYKKKHPTYQVLPPMREDCIEGNKQQVLDFIYPKHGATLHPVKGLGGSIQPIIARVAYKYSGKLFWYLDNHFLGETLHFHDMKLYLSEGTHLLKCMDTRGNEKTIVVKSEE